MQKKCSMDITTLSKKYESVKIIEFMPLNSKLRKLFRNKIHKKLVIYSNFRFTGHTW